MSFLDYDFDYSLLQKYARQNGCRMLECNVERDFERIPEDKQTDVVFHRMESDLTETFCLYKMDSEKCVAFMGAEPVTEDTIEVWLHPYKGRAVKTRSRMAKMTAEAWAKSVDRMQSLVHSKNKKAHKFNRFIGMEKESTIEKFKDGEDYFMFRRLCS